MRRGYCGCSKPAPPRSNVTVIAEIIADSADPLAGEVYAALDMPFAVLVGQIVHALTKT